ncbi:MAG: M14 family metallopeptidase [Candidatus Saccharicenans sp.]
MVKKTFYFLPVFIMLWGLAMTNSFSQTVSLSQLYFQGKTLIDEDGDGWAEKVELNVIIPDNPSPIETSLAAEIAARINLESLSLNFDLVHRESEIKNLAAIPNPVIIGTNLNLSRKILKELKLDPGSLKPNQGLILTFSYQGAQGWLCLAGSEETLLKTGRAYFLRWPYLWEIWGRNSGFTFLALEKDIENFLLKEDIRFQKTIVSKILYTFPPVNLLPGNLKSLNFENGEISTLTIKLYFTDSRDLEKAYAALRILSGQRAKGLRTEVLAYPACAQLEFNLISGRQEEKVFLERPGSTKRLLTPSFKEMPPRPEKNKKFDLTGVFTEQGVYIDRNQDGLPDGLDTTVIIPNQSGISQLPLLTTRLVLDTAGSSFPITCLDREVENKSSLIAPILVGQNSLTEDLLKSGRLRIPPLEPYQGIIKTAPGFGSSEALIVYSPSPAGLDKTLEYLSLKFPYLTDYKKGQPEISWIKDDLEKFLEGEKGAAEAYFEQVLSEEIEKLKSQALENLELNIYLPEENKDYEDYLEKYLKKSLLSPEVKVTVSSFNQGQIIFNRETTLPWEAEEALSLLRDKLNGINTAAPVKVSLGLSESPAVRLKLKQEVEEILKEYKLTGEVEVLSAYKPGFYWLTEKIIPALKNKPVHKILIRFSPVNDSPTIELKRFYSDPNRWLQELYPVDEFIAGELGIPLEKIEMEMKPVNNPVYEVLAFDDKNNILLHEGFSPRTREIPFLKLFPEWGSVNVTTGWLTISQDQKVIFDNLIKTDPERFWDYYQNEVLSPLYDFIMKKTNHEPTFSQQPYFKKLMVELWLSEPDYLSGSDQEIISSLEALHDEIYFDTLDFLRGLTGFGKEEKDLPTDTSRSSAPGNVQPVIHSSTEGQGPKIKVILEDFAARQPRMVLQWKVSGQSPVSKAWEFEPIKTGDLELSEIIFNSMTDSLESAAIDVPMEKEADYEKLARLIDIFEQQREKKLNTKFFSYPHLNHLLLRIYCQNLNVEKSIEVISPEEIIANSAELQKHLPVPTDHIIGPEEGLKISEALGQFPAIREYRATNSLEGRPVPVLEIYWPSGKYVSRPRLVTFKPVLHLTARQHANEVSSTNYSLKLAELLATDKNYEQYLKKVSVIIQPMENPDGAQLALNLFQNEPFHSLHAGRYSSLGVDIGYQIGLKKALLPEAKVREKLSKEWVPDIYLNLHGYPSHEWVQLFSGYSPYLFRDYWIPKGWFTYLRQMNLNIYQPYVQAAVDLKKILIQEMNSDPKIRESNSRFYARYDRWARRWSPFISPLEINDGLNIYSKRQSSTENRLTAKTERTYIEETPEVMDETAVGHWLEFICEQGLAYLRAHLKYLNQVQFETAVIEEEVNNRIRIEFYRRRPGAIEKSIEK